MQQDIRFTTTSDHVRIAYATSGTGPPLIRVTNWITHLESDWDSPVWGHWFRELSRSHTLVRYDARGTGLSDRSVDHFSLDGWVKDLEAVVDDLQLETFALLGICQGAATSVAYASQNPDRVHSLVLYDSYPAGSFADDAPPEERRRARALGEMIEVGWADETAAFRELFANLLVPEADREVHRWLAKLQRESTSAETATRLWDAFHSLDVRELCPKVQSPTAVFHVRGDDMVPFEEGRQMATLIPEARFVPLEGENHILLENEPGWSVFVDRLTGFLGEHQPRSTSVGCDEEKVALLTPREREVLDLLGDGLTNNEIAERLFISEKTVRNHVTRIYAKLEVDNRARAVVLARETRSA